MKIIITTTLTTDGQISGDMVFGTSGDEVYIVFSFLKSIEYIRKME